MAENELSVFLRARREAITPEEAGLPSGPRRRTPGLRRSELATLAGISVEYLTRLEQGRDRNPSPQVLGALADALRLNTDDRLYLRFAAKSAAGDSFMSCPGAHPPEEEPRPTLRAILDGLEPAPALLHNRLGDILARTPAFERLAGPLGLLDEPRPNLLRFVFTHPRAREVHPEWDEVAERRLHAIRNGQPPNDPHLSGLLDELSVSAGAAFTAKLACAPVPPPHSGVEVLRHPEAGLLRLSYDTLTSGDQSLLVYQPADPASALALERLSGFGALRAVDRQAV
ncbi:helix-turn-helix domain-containing protein [Actinocorallia populi]|uniref:helix-turn-helix domain-containing protein n=1 Tax=Actinocorallia populi TaxID=2079200 RepID=UPI000D08FE05|nr:helix-turn-helix domain-containing protein [Actinocorallia populi]